MSPRPPRHALRPFPFPSPLPAAALAFCLSLGLSLGLSATAAHAQLSDSSLASLEERPMSDAAAGAASTELGFGQIDEDFFLALELRFTFGLPVPMVACLDEDDGAMCATRLRFGVAVPLRFRVIDREPHQEGVLRAEDWAEFSDYLRVIRFIEYGYPHEPLYARLGELGPALLGHGTIVNGYYNVITTDHYQLGSQLNVNTVYGGVETLINNLVGPHVLGLRTYVRPFAFIDRESFWNRLAIGTSLVSDVTAPTVLRRDAGDLVVVGADRRPVVAEDQATVIGGVDVELNLVRTELVSVTPYTDLNYHFGLGGGLHSGVLLQFWPLESLGLFTRFEYRFLGSNYLPDYIGPLYEIDRYQYTGWGQELAAPKLRVARTLERGSLHGFYGQASANLFGLVTLAAAYEDYEGADNASLRLRGTVTASDAVQLGLFYTKHNFDGLGEAFDLDGAMLVTEARMPLAGPLHLSAAYSRLWRLEDTGEYTTVHDWHVGVGAALAF